MLWKEHYKIGVETIDRQHQELFQITESLLTAVTQGAGAAVYEQSLAFLTRYVVEHFRDEEAYQSAIHYSGLPLHREEHAQFTRAIHAYAQRWEDSGHDPAVMKNLSGMTTAWLIYHVISADRNIVAPAAPAAETPHYDRCVEVFAASALDVLGMMAGLDRSQVQVHSATPYIPTGALYITIELVGDRPGTAVFAFSRAFALQLVCAMTMMEMQELDGIVQSALCEIANICCGNGTTTLAAMGIACDIRPPVVSETLDCDHSGVGLHLDTPMGWLEIALLMADTRQQLLP